MFHLRDHLILEWCFDRRKNIQFYIPLQIRNKNVNKNSIFLLKKGWVHWNHILIAYTDKSVCKKFPFLIPKCVNCDFQNTNLCKTNHENTILKKAVNGFKKFLLPNKHIYFHSSLSILSGSAELETDKRSQLSQRKIAIEDFIFIKYNLFPQVHSSRLNFYITWQKMVVYYRNLNEIISMLPF